MTKESLYAPEPIFRETFNSEFDTRKNKGTPTDVTFENGEGTFDGTSSMIDYASRFNGTYSIRVKCNPTSFTDNRFLVDIRTTGSDGTGYYYLAQNTGNISGTGGGTKYVNGVATSTATAGVDNDIVITGTALTTGTGTYPFLIGMAYVLSGGFPGTFDLVEIYEGTLTVSQVANLYAGKTYRELPPNDVLIDFDCRNGAIEDKQVGSIVGDDVIPVTAPTENHHCTSVRVSQGTYNITTTNSASTNIWGWSSVYENNKKYKMSFQAKSDDTTITPSYYDGTGNIAFDTGGALTTEWQTYIADFTYGADASRRFFIYQQQPSVGDVINYRGLVVYEVRDDLANTSTTIVKDGSYAAKFDGANSKVDIGSDMIGVKAVTVMAWIKPYGWGEGGTGSLIHNGKIRIATKASGEKIQITSAHSLYVYSAANSIDLSRWQFVAVTRTAAGVVNFYIGDLDTAPALSAGADQDSGTPTAGTTNVIIGNADAQTHTFDGLINKVKCVEGILSLAEITQEYSSTKESIK